MTLTQDRLKQLLSYDLETGLFTWKQGRGGRVSGSVAGHIEKSWGYWIISIDSRNYKAHRLAWLYVHGVWPEKDLDHENEIKTDNRIANLREATGTQNKLNRAKPYANNTSGYLGVCLYKPTNKWTACVRVNGRRKFHGYFDTPEQASEAYLAAKSVHRPDAE